MFSLFAVVNGVTGVFVETALQANQRDRLIIIKEELDSKAEYLRMLSEVFEEMDSEGSGNISASEFEKSLNDEKVIAYFHHLKLDVTDARLLFELLDYDRSDTVNIDEFVKGCYRLQGEPRNLDLQMM